MTQTQVQKILSEDPDHAKEISLNDGKRYLVRERERWLAGFVLILMDRKGDFIHIAYHNIASIRVVKNGKHRQ